MTVGELRKRLELFDDAMPVLGFWDASVFPVAQVLGCQHHVILDVEKDSQGDWTSDEMNRVIGPLPPRSSY